MPTSKAGKAMLLREGTLMLSGGGRKKGESEDSLDEEEEKKKLSGGKAGDLCEEAWAAQGEGEDNEAERLYKAALREVRL